MKKIYKICAALVFCLIFIFSLNFFNLQRHINTVLKEDSRNKGIKVWVHYSWWLNPREIKYDLRDISGDNSTADVTRVLLQFSEKIKNKEFDKVILSYRGTSKGYFKGEYFQTIGKEYEFQNPVYTLRTMPENVYALDGQPKYGTWTGGWIGVMGRQLEDLNSFAKDWYLDEIMSK